MYIIKKDPYQYFVALFVHSIFANSARILIKRGILKQNQRVFKNNHFRHIRKEGAKEYEETIRINQ
jgi:hypothetical protein